MNEFNKVIPNDPLDSKAFNGNVSSTVNSTGWEEEYYKNRREYLKLIDETMIQNPNGKIDFLEESICEHTDRDYSVAVANGTDALHMALIAIGIEPGDEVLVTNFSWLSSATCVSLVGATPVFCDIDISSYHMSLDSIKRMVSPKTKAIVYPHLFGNMSDTREILAFCEENEIVFVEDACQCIGSMYRNTKAGSIGDISTLSFNSNKNIAGIGGGGAVMTNNEEYAEKIRKLREYGKGEYIGFNSKLLLLEAKIIDHRLKSLDEWQFLRQKNAELYHNAFGDLPMHLQQDPNVDHNYTKYVVRFENKKMRDRIQRKTKTSIHYSMPISENKVYESLPHRKDKYPNSKLLSDTILTLPLTHQSYPVINAQIIKAIWEEFE